MSDSGDIENQSKNVEVSLSNIVYYSKVFKSYRFLLRDLKSSIYNVYTTCIYVKRNTDFCQNYVV